MHVNLISIFPEYFSPLSLSLLGKAQEKGLIKIDVTDLREFTFDKHKTVDDAPKIGNQMIADINPFITSYEVLKTVHSKSFQARACCPE